jgi:hypothetical protein
MISRLRAFLESISRFMARVWLAILYLPHFSLLESSRAFGLRGNVPFHRLGAFEGSASNIEEARRQF